MLVSTFDCIVPSQLKIFKSSGGCKIHILRSTATSHVGFNILMDDQNLKYPGHTHASFRVPSVAAVEKYLTEYPLPLVIRCSISGVVINNIVEVYLFVVDTGRWEIEMLLCLPGDIRINNVKAYITS